MTSRKTALAGALFMLAAMLAPAATAAPAARYATWTHVGLVYNGAWEQTAHWSPYYNMVPENGTYQWYVQFNLLPQSYYVEVSDSHTVTSITANTFVGYLVELTNWTGDRVWLQFTTFTNSGNLHVNNIDLYGPVSNYGDWTVRGGMVNYNGNVTNYAGAFWNVKGNLEVKGTFTNQGHARAYGGATLWADAFINNDRVSLLGGSVGSDAEFANHADAEVVGAGSFYAPSGIDNQGAIRAETGTLAVYCGEGTLTNTGHLENLPNTALAIEADEVDHQGTLAVGSGGGVTFVSCDLDNKPGAEVALLGGTLAAPHLTHRSGAGFTGFGNVTADLTNQGLIDLYGPSQIVGDVQNDAEAQLAIRNADLLIAGDTVNHGTIRAVNGKVYFEGNLVNNGTLIMDPSLAVVVGDLTVGTSGVLAADAGSTYQMMGRFDNRSTRAAAFDLAAATVEFLSRGPAAAPSEVEVAGKNLGAVAAGWTRNFALGTLRVGNETWPGRVRLVDDRDNQGDGLPEALYVRHLAVAPGSTLETGGLPVYADGTVETGGTLDLAAGHLVVDYRGASPFTAILAQVAAGCSGGAWDGAGVTSSHAATHPQALTAVGVIDNSDPEIGIGGLAAFAGAPVDATSVLVGYTWYGDANLDGVVDSNDYDRIDSNWLLWTAEGRLPPGGFRWAVGDFNYDGTIDSNDYDKIDNAWLFSNGAPLSGGSPPAPTPEPATLALVGFGLVAGLLRRRRR